MRRGGLSLHGRGYLSILSLARCSRHSATLPDDGRRSRTVPSSQTLLRRCPAEKCGSCPCFPPRPPRDDGTAVLLPWLRLFRCAGVSFRFAAILIGRLIAEDAEFQRIRLPVARQRQFRQGELLLDAVDLSGFQSPGCQSIPERCKRPVLAV